MRSGELFAGVGGLGMAVDDVFDSTPAWFAEFDTAPSKVLAYRHPGVPNHGDVTKLTAPEKVQILAGGFPCQDVSLAGRRRGMKDGTRSGLWSEFARLIDTVRPDWVVIENVRGLLSADAAGDVESCPLCVGDDPGHVLRALGAVLGDLAELGFDAEWTGIRASDVGAPHGRFRVFILAWPRVRTRLDKDATGSGGAAIADSDGRVHEPRGAWTDQRRLQGGDGSGAGSSESPLTLLPTPVAQPSGNTPEDHLRKKPGREVVTDLAIIAENGLIGSGGRLLPTPTAQDSSASGGSNEHNVTLTDAVVRTDLGSRPNERLLPTPGAYDGERGGSQHPDKRRAGNHSVTIQDVAEHTTDWGPYEPAIRRWEAVIGRPAPSPVRYDGKGGKPRLNPELTEWMMGWPAGHVTNPAIGLTRAEQLKACGNGVVPQQAAAALRELLARPGVPELLETS